VTTTTHLDAARVLTGIIRRAQEAGLPLLHWSLHPNSSNVSGSPFIGDDDETQSATMAAWAAHLGVEVETEQHASYTGAEIEIVIDGVRVKIWAHVARSASYGQVGGAQ
jgi:ABC-type sugar transport system substrate-binding protein